MRSLRSTRGSMLIVAIGMLTLISIMAATFWALMRLERSAATNYIDGKKAEFTADAGRERLVAQAKRFARENAFEQNGRLRKFIFGATGANRKEIDVTRPVEEINPQLDTDAFFYGKTGVSYPGATPNDGAGDEYRVKVVDTSALFDLNFPMELTPDPTGSGGSTGKPLEGQMLELMLQSLGEAIKDDLARHPGKTVFDPINGDDPKSHRKSASFGQFTGAMAILAYRATLDGMRFTSKSQLQEVMEEASYAVLSDYVTAHGPVDDFSVEPKQLSGTHSGVRRLLQPRSLINVNLAARPVLIAAIAPIAGRRHCYMVSTKMQIMEAQDATARETYVKGPGTGKFLVDDVPGAIKEESEYDVHEGWLYVGPFGTTRATEIADWIIANRPFNGYAELHDRLYNEMLKPTRKHQPGALDGAMPPPKKLAKTEKLSEPGTRVVPPRNAPRWNIEGIETEPYFKTLVREAGYSLLLANFNPGFTANSAVPNSATYLPIDKGNLLYPDQKALQDDNDGAPISRQSFEFCFDTMGTFEITSLGQIRKPFGEIVAQEKMLSVVRLMGKMTHRTQWDFELNDKQYTTDTAGGKQRETFTTFPNPRRLFATAAEPVPVPNSFASSDWGHVEIETFSVFEDPRGKNPRPGIFTVPMGGLLMGSFFEWPKVGSGWAQTKSLCAYVADRDKYIFKQPSDGPDGGDDYTKPGIEPSSPKPFNEAHGKLPTIPPNATIPTVSNGSCSIYNDGVHMSYRRGRDNTLWYRAGAPSDTDLDVVPPRAPNDPGDPNSDRNIDQGAMPLHPTDVPDYTGAPQERLLPYDPPAAATAPPTHRQGNIWYRKGGVSFWYKPEFDWAFVDDRGDSQPFPLYCGYVFASRVYYNPGVKVQNYGDSTHVVDASITNPDKPGDLRGMPTDGTQLYLFRNSLGQIRATRLFFRVVGKVEKKDLDAVTYPIPKTSPLAWKERPSRFLDPEAGDKYGEKAHEEYPGALSFVAGELDPGVAAAKGGAVDVYRRGRERRPFWKFTTKISEPHGYPWPPLEFARWDEVAATAAAASGNFKDIYKPSEHDIHNARVDSYVPFERLRSWRAGEWHHIAVYWNDDQAGATADKYLRIYVDGVQQSESKIIGDEEFSFVRLNEPPEMDAAGGGRKPFPRYPKDQIQVGCIQRRIAQNAEGVFKHKNTFNPDSTDVSQDPTEINLFACGVMDDFLTYDGTNPPSEAFPVPKRFEPEAIYVNHFDLRSRLPGGQRPLELARLAWTILLPPTRYSPFIPNDTPLDATGGTAEISVSSSGNVKLKNPKPGGAEGPMLFKRDSGGNVTECFGQLVEGGTSNPGLLPPAPAQLRYEIMLKPLTFKGAGGSTNVRELPYVDTPALQEISVFYYLPTEETLLRERIVD